MLTRSCSNTCGALSIKRIASFLVKSRVPCVLLVFAALLVFSLEDRIEISNDTGAYILLAQSLASGDGYQDIYLDGTPAHTKYPAVFPLLLTPVVLLFGLNLMAMRLFMIGLGVLALYAVYSYLRRFAGERDAFSIVVLTGASYGIWFYSQSISSEIPYILFSFLALMFLESYKEEQQRILARAWMAALMVGVASLTRTIGLALLVGAVAYIAFEGRRDGRVCWRSRLLKSSLIALLGGLPVLLWMMRNWFVSEGTTPVGYLREYGLRSYAFTHASEDSGFIGLKDLLVLLYHNLYLYTFACARIILPYFSELTGKFAAISLTIFVLIGFFMSWFKKRTALEYYVVLYLLAVLFFPASYDRYLVPIIPIIFYYFLRSLYSLIGLLFVKSRYPFNQELIKPLYLSIAVVLVGVTLSFSIQHTFISRNIENSFRIDMDESMYAEIIPWVIQNTEPSSLFMWSKPALRYALSRRKAVPLPSTSDETRIVQRIDELGVDFVVVDSFSDKTLRYLNPMIAEYPEKFSLQYQTSVSAIYKVER